MGKYVHTCVFCVRCHKKGGKSEKFDREARKLDFSNIAILFLDEKSKFAKMFPNFALKRLYIEKIPPNVSEMASKSIFREKLYFLQKFVERLNR